MQLDHLPLKQIYITVFSSIVITSLVMFKIIEKVSWLDAVYFVVVTMSTVGFGDVTASYEITKIVTLILIFNGLSSIGIASQLLLDRIVKFQLSKQKLLPKQPLNLENHIVIAGFGSKGRRLAQLFKDRSFVVVIVEFDETEANLAEFNNYIVIQGDITKPSVLEILALDNAAALCLLLSDDDITIQSGILARSLSDSIDIYAEIRSSTTYDIARIAGINKPIPFISFMTNELQNHLTHAQIELFYNIKELTQQEANLGYALVHQNLDYRDLFKDSLRLGQYSFAMNELYLDYKANIVSNNLEFGNHLLIAVDKLELIRKYKGEITKQIPHKRIIFAGFSELASSVISRLEQTHEDVIILWNSIEEKELANSLNCKKIQWKFDDADELLEKIVENDDLIVCSFKNITESLLLAITLKKLNRNTHLLQVVPYEYEAEPFIRVGADAVITPQQVISNAVLSIFLKENQLPPSIVFTKTHIFEHYVEKNDRYENNKIKDIMIEGYQVLYVKSEGEDTFRGRKKSDKIHYRDRILVAVNYK